MRCCMTTQRPLHLHHTNKPSHHLPTISYHFILFHNKTPTCTHFISFHIKTPTGLVQQAEAQARANQEEEAHVALLLSPTTQDATTTPTTTAPDNEEGEDAAAHAAALAQARQELPTRVIEGEGAPLITIESGHRTIFMCRVCGVSATSARNYLAHIQVCLC